VWRPRLQKKILPAADTPWARPEQHREITVKRAYCISYVPLLRGRPGIDLTEKVRRDPDRIRQLLTGTVSGLATACLWLRHEGRPLPVLVYDRGTEIHEHLLEWAEDDPPAWFTLHLGELPAGAEASPGYVAVLQPRLDRSVERFRQSFRPGLLDEATIEVLFSPLYLVSSGTTYQRLKDQIGPTSLLGILDARDFDPHRPGKLDPRAIHMLGPFAVRDMAELGGAEAFLRSPGGSLPE
jgi:hypothetical protein